LVELLIEIFRDKINTTEWKERD